MHQNLRIGIEAILATFTLVVFVIVIVLVMTSLGNSHANAVRCEERGGSIYLRRGGLEAFCLKGFEVVDLDAPARSLPADIVQRLESQPRLIVQY